MAAVGLRGHRTPAGARGSAERARHAGFGPGPRVVSPGTSTPSPSRTAGPAPRPSPATSSTAVYGHGIMDMKVVLVCQIVAMEALRDCGVPLSGRLAMAVVSDHMGDQIGSIVYFDPYDADKGVLGELSDNEIFLGHRGLITSTSSFSASRRTPATSRSRSTPTCSPRTRSSSLTGRGSSPELDPRVSGCSARRRSCRPAASTAGCRPVGRR